MNSLSAAHMRALDKKASEEYGIPSIVLMENAGLRAADVIASLWKSEPSKCRVVVICGAGNNGGDGFVVVRHLMNKGFCVSVYVLTTVANIKGDSLTNLLIIERMKVPITFTGTVSAGESFIKNIAASDIIVDAIFGTGLERTIQEPISSYINAINEAGKNSRKRIVSIDMPSGIHADTGAVLGVAVKASTTVTFAAPKDGLLVAKGPDNSGEVVIVDISIPKENIYPPQ
jgi:hydroxyethylthiazole kinase-like uncharacterized protein yjeF